MMIANDYYFDEEQYYVKYQNSYDPLYKEAKISKCIYNMHQKQFVMANDQYNLGLESGYEVLNESLYDIIIKIYYRKFIIARLQNQDNEMKNIYLKANELIKNHTLEYDVQTMMPFMQYAF